MKKLMLVLLMIPGILLSQEYLAFNHTKNKKIYDNKASVIDLKTNAAKIEINLGKSFKSEGYYLNLKDSNRLYYYIDHSKKESEIMVYDLNNYKQVYAVKINPINYYASEVFGRLEFYNLSADGNFLYIQTHDGSQKQIVIINNTTGGIVKTIPLGKTAVMTRLSDDGKYFFVSQYNGGKLTVISTTSYETIYKSSGYKVPPDYFKDAVFSTYQVKTKTGKAKRIKIAHLLTRQGRNVEGYFSGDPVFYKDKENNKFFVFALDKKSRRLKAYKYEKDNLVQIDIPDIKLKPKSVFKQEGSPKLLISGFSKTIIFDPSQPANISVLDTPFDVSDMAFNFEKNRLFVKEGKGSEVGAIDLITGKLINRSGTGRAGVKFGQFLASTALTAAGMYYGYSSVLITYSNTAMKFNQKGDRLYVINTKTSDVTAFNANDLSGRESLYTGNGETLIYTPKIDNAPVIVLSSNMLTVIDDTNLKTSTQVKFDELLGVDMDQYYLFVKQEEKVNCYSMIDGSLINSLNVENPSLIIPIKPSMAIK